MKIWPLKLRPRVAKVAVCVKILFIDCGSPLRVCGIYFGSYGGIRGSSNKE